MSNADNVLYASLFLGVPGSGGVEIVERIGGKRAQVTDWVGFVEHGKVVFANKETIVFVDKSTHEQTCSHVALVDKDGDILRCISLGVLTIEKGAGVEFAPGKLSIVQLERAF
jgi:hypothetical protein